MVIQKFLKLKPSQLLLVALDDLDKVEDDPILAVDMDQWVTFHDSRCFVCFAGGMLVNSIGVSARELAACGGPDWRSMDLLGMLSMSFPEEDFEDMHLLASRCVGLDHIRQGFLMSGLSYFEIPPKLQHMHFPKVTVCPYEVDPFGFKRSMRGIAHRLAYAGL